MEVLYNPKCKTLFKRDENFKVIPSMTALTDPRFEFVSDRGWVVTKKMDGMSIILAWDGWDFKFHGRSPKTDFNTPQLEYLQGVAGKIRPNMVEHFDEIPVHIYAEFVGPKINGNKHGYGEYHLFVFDVRIGGFWLDWHNVVDVAQKVELQTVRRIHELERGGLEKIYREVSALARVGTSQYFEGVVCRTDPYFYTAQGDRVMFKLKLTDIPR